jgi:hypothetical protein
LQRVTTSIVISAPVERVWSVLMDFAAYPSWNPFIRSLSGGTTPGSRLTVTIEPVGGKAMSFSPQVIVCEREKEFRWKGRVLLPGVFDGEHHFRLARYDDASTTFEHGEDFTGILVPFVMRGSMKAGTEAGFVAMNHALKDRVEARRS